MKRYGSRKALAVASPVARRNDSIDGCYVERRSMRVLGRARTNRWLSSRSRDPSRGNMQRVALIQDLAGTL
jgi:hypothetical protein